MPLVFLFTLLCFPAQTRQVTVFIAAGAAATAKDALHGIQTCLVNTRPKSTILVFEKHVQQYLLHFRIMLLQDPPNQKINSNLRRSFDLKPHISKPASIGISLSAPRFPPTPAKACASGSKTYTPLETSGIEGISREVGRQFIIGAFRGFLCGVVGMVGEGISGVLLYTRPNATRRENYRYLSSKPPPLKCETSRSREHLTVDCVCRLALRVLFRICFI